MLVGIVACICFLTHPIVPNTETNAVGGEPTTKPPSAPDWLRGKFNLLQPAWFDLLQPAWGLHGGLVYAILPGISKGTSSESSNNTATTLATKSQTAPRGLIRLFSPVLDGGRYDLVNFIAIEPVVGGKRGLSELEHSRLDGVPGKRIWVSAGVPPQMPGEAGRLTKLKSGVEELEVVLRVERFDNGAHVYLVATQFSNDPDEIRFTVHREPDSAPIQFCVLTATMGNKARTRLLWLKGEVASSHQLYPIYHDLGFAAERIFPLARLFHTIEGSVLVAVTNDEQNPAAVFPFPGTHLWYYGGAKVTQYWRKPKGTFRGDLTAAVNGRYVYWRSKQPVPGGIAFENFEMREPFSEGQSVVFGITRRTPAELGFRAADTTGKVGN
jgi:hypothetical protein